MRRGSSPRMDSLEALCRVLGFRLEMVPLDEPGHPPEEVPAVETRPEWSRRLREEIRQDLVEVLGLAGKGGALVERTRLGPHARENNSLVLPIVRPQEDAPGYNLTQSNQQLTASMA